MQTELEALCENCDSKFSLKYDTSAVYDYETICCPFCKEYLNHQESDLNYQLDGDEILDDTLL